MRPIKVRFLLLGAALFFFAPGLLQAQSGTVVGTVTGASDGVPLQGAQVTIVGSNRGDLTDAEGAYAIPGVNAGSVTVRVVLLGFSQATRELNVPAGGSVSADFQLEETALEMDALIATVTGRETRRREIGSSVGSIDVSAIDLAPITNISNLLQGRVAGLSVLQSSGTVGSGSRIRIRGSNSVSLSNAPLVVVDGIRVNADPTSYDLFTGGQQSSRMNDLNPENIESITVLRGPSAAALYGTAAANGVLQITTRRGRSGDASWRFWAEGRTLDKHVTIPGNFYSVTAEGGRCDLLAQDAGTCTPAQILSFNPLETDSTTLLRDGWGQTYGASVSGGGETATYYVSGEFEDQTGVQVENQSRQVNVQGNLTGQVRDNLSVSANVGYTDAFAQFPQNDNSGLGVLWNAMRGQPFPSVIANNDGFAFPPAFLLAWDNFQDVSRTTASASANWQPLDWLTVGANGGVDDVSRLDHDFVEPGTLTIFGFPFADGFREIVDYSIVHYTATGDATAEFVPREDLVSTTSLGVQYFEDQNESVFTSGVGIAPGTKSLAGASEPLAVGEATIENVTLGTYLAQQLAWRDNVFLNAAIRGDKNSAFGLNLGWIWYPSFSGSWIISDETFFPEMDALGSLRLRAAWGQSGLRPGFRDALLFFETATAAREDVTVPGFVISGAGNPDLEPQRSTEFEIGFEAGLLDERIGLELTYYDKESENDIVDQPLPPSVGGSETQTVNLGDMSNRGFEWAGRFEILRGPRTSWQFSILGSHNDNELESLGDRPQQFFGLFGDSQTFAEGHPAGAYWQRPILGFDDTSGDGIIGLDEVDVADDATFVGEPFPTTELSLSTTVTLWERLTLSGLLDFRGGHQLLNVTTWDHCDGSFSTCRARHDPDAPLSAQAAAVAYEKEGTFAGYVEDADFWKLRQLSASFRLPSEWAQYAHSRSASLTLAGQNLFTWTDYSGLDPEINFSGQSNFTTAENTTLPPFRTFSVRIDLAF